jgi:hypothetical protein
MAKAADFSGRPPGAAALRAAGFTVVLRYIGLGSEGKQIHRTEWEDYLRHGILVILIAELGVDDAWASLDDYRTGQARARVALDDLAAECPASVNPDTVLIGCAADAHATSAAQITDAIQYSRGFASVVGLWRAGFYGFRETSTAVHEAGAASWHWRCGSEPTTEEKRWVTFWQRNRTDPGSPARVTINGTDIDVNEIYAFPQKGDDMSWDDTFAVPAGPNAGTQYTARDYLVWTNYYANQIPALQATVAELAAAVVGGIDKETVLAKVDTAVREATTQAVTGTVLPVLRDVMREVLGDDKTEQADAIVTRLAERLRPAA